MTGNRGRKEDTTERAPGWIALSFTAAGMSLIAGLLLSFGGTAFWGAVLWIVAGVLLVLNLVWIAPLMGRPLQTRTHPVRFRVVKVRVDKVRVDKSDLA